MQQVAWGVGFKLGSLFVPFGQLLLPNCNSRRETHMLTQHLHNLMVPKQWPSTPLAGPSCKGLLVRVSAGEEAQSLGAVLFGVLQCTTTELPVLWL